MEAIIVILSILIVGVIVYFTVKNGLHKKDANTIKGEEGELAVKQVLGYNIPNRKYVINDYYTTLNDRSVQIDHILINKSGVFIIETKNYSGAIYGNENDHEWLQVLAGGKTKNNLHSPIKQNKSHIYAVRKFIPKDIPVYPIVVLVQNNSQNIDVDYVIDLADLKQYIKKQPKYLDSNGIVNIYNKINIHNLKGLITEQDHIDEIHQMQQDIENNICPRCGGKLVVRHGQYGDFLGCENYPKCTFHKEIGNHND